MTKLPPHGMGAPASRSSPGTPGSASSTSSHPGGLSSTASSPRTPTNYRLELMSINSTWL